MSLEIISKKFPFGEYADLLECTSLMLHISSVTRHVRKGDIAPLLDSYSRLHFNVGSHIYHRGNYGDALFWYGQALSGRKREQGSDYSSPLTTAYNIGLVFDNQGKYDDALEWYRRALSGPGLGPS
jgi:tetratricopeptide (TPR) repeat protein